MQNSEDDPLQLMAEGPPLPKKWQTARKVSTIAQKRTIIYSTNQFGKLSILCGVVAMALSYNPEYHSGLAEVAHIVFPVSLLTTTSGIGLYIAALCGHRKDAARLEELQGTAPLELHHFFPPLPTDYTLEDRARMGEYYYRLYMALQARGRVK